MLGITKMAIKIMHYDFPVALRAIEMMNGAALIRIEHFFSLN